MSDSSHIIWPAAIIGLLLLSGLTVVAVFVASQSDGGAKVVDNYYEKSVAWDSIAAVRDESASLGWVTSVRVEQSTEGSFGVLTVVDANGIPVTGLTGEIRVGRPQTSDEIGRQAMAPIPGAPGVYRFDFPYHGRGLWDFGIEASRNQERYAGTIRIEV